MRKTIATAPNAPTKHVNMNVQENADHVALESAALAKGIDRENKKTQRDGLKVAAKNRLKLKLNLTDSDLNDLKMFLSD